MKLVNQGLPVTNSFWVWQNLNYCFLAQFWFLCQSFTNNSYSFQVTHLYLLLSRSFDWFSWMFVFAHLILLVVRRDLVLYSPVDKKERSLLVDRLTFTGSLNCLEHSLLLGEVHPSSRGLRFGEDKIHCCSSVPSIGRKLSGRAKEGHKFWSLEKWSWIPVCHFSPWVSIATLFSVLIIIDPWNTQGILLKHGILKCKNTIGAIKDGRERWENLIEIETLANSCLFPYFNLQVGIGFMCIF